MRRALLATVVVGLGLDPGSAQAKGAVVFDRTVARAGDRLAVLSSFGPRPATVVLYLVPLPQAPQFQYIPYQGWPRPEPGPPPHVRGLRALGSPAGRAGTHRLYFRAPTAPGLYTLVVWCRSCRGERGTHWVAAAPNFVPVVGAVLRVREA